MRTTIHLHRRGSVLVTAMWICIALTAVALVLCREITVESLASVQHLAQAKADSAELGVEQLVLSWVASDLETPGSLDGLSMEQRELGDCYFWIIKANPDDEQTPAFGLAHEAGKIDINTATYDELMALPNMTDELASSIIDWRDADDDPTGTDGAEDSYYMQLDHPYHCKNSNFESIQELWLVKGATPDLLIGVDYNQNETIEPSELDSANQGANFEISARGLLDFFTVYGVKGTNPPTSTTGTTTGTTGAATTSPLANVNATSTTALRTALQQYLPARASAGLPTGPFLSVFDWAVKMNLSSDEFSQIYPYITWNPRAAGGGGRGGVTATTTTTSTPVAKLDIMEASEAAMLAIGLEDSEAQAIISYRANNSIDPTQRSNVAWLLDVVSHDKFTTANTDGSSVGAQITGTSTVYSAEIVTVSKDGRAFKRVKIVVDGSTYANALLASTASTTGTTATTDTSGTLNTPILIHREDHTNLGWPLDPAIRNTLRSGQSLDQIPAAGNRLGLGTR